MPSLADMMKDSPDEEDMPASESGEADHEAMGAASMKAMYESMRTGDFKAAYQHFCDMAEHGKSGGKDMPALLLMGKDKAAHDDY